MPDARQARPGVLTPHLPTAGAVLAFCAALAMTGCSAAESEEERSVSYTKNVESCLCRTLEFEVDSPNGLTWERMIEHCNRTVHGANPQRYPASAHAAPAVDTLRCPWSVEEWKAGPGA